MNQHLQTMGAQAAGWLRALGAAALNWRPDMLMAAGAATVSFGAWQVYRPAGWIVGGAFLLLAGVLEARKKAV